MKKMKIVNKKKFIRSMVIVLAIGLLVLLFINTNKSFSHGETEYKTLYVANGDTLWNIAKVEKDQNTYFMGKDIRDIVAIIKTTNELTSTDLSINQELKIPTIS